MKNRTQVLANILLVDDDEIILETFKEILENEGFVVNTASNSYTAIQIIKNQDIKLAILDYNLPNIAGTQLGHLIKKAQKSTVIIFISGTPEIHEIAKTMDYKVCKVFSKPIDLELLIQTMKSALGETRVISISSVGLSVEKQIPNQFSRLVNNLT